MEKETKNSVTINAVCVECKHHTNITVFAHDYLDWKQGLLIKKAFPYLDADQRELLISGICPECWTKMFPPDEEEDTE